MKKFVSILLVMVLMITSLSVGMVGFAENNATANAIKGVSVSAKTQNSKYNWGDEIYFDVTVKNTTDETINNIKISSLAKKITYFYEEDGSGSAVIDTLQPGETKTVQIMYVSQKLPFFIRLFILPFVSIAESITGLTFGIGAYDAVCKAKVGLFSYRFGFMVGENKEVTSFAEPKEENVVTDTTTGVRFVNNEVLVSAKDGITRSQIEDIVAEYEGKIVGSIESFGEYQIRLNSIFTKSELDKVVQKIASSACVLTASINYAMNLSETDYLVPQDPWGGNQNWSSEIPEGNNWGVEAIKAPVAWAHRDEMNPITIGLIDSGFDTQHSDLTISCPQENVPVDDHGTHVAGTMAADMDNDGITGVMPTSKQNGERLVSLFGVSQNGSGFEEWFTFEMNCCYAELLIRGSKVINISQGFNWYMGTNNGWGNDYWTSDNITQKAQNLANSYAKPQTDFLKKALSKGFEFILVCAAGNDGGINARYSSPMNAITDTDIKSRIIVVGAIGNLGKDGNRHKGYEIASFSNVGNRVDVVAPGDMIYSTVPVALDTDGNADGFANTYVQNGNTYLWSGTSMAAPHVAGVAAMVWSINPNLTGIQVKDFIKTTADRPIPHNGISYSILNAENAVNKAIASKSGVNPWQPDPTHNGALISRVVKASDQSPIKGAQVSAYLTSGQYVDSATTDDAGQFELLIPAGTYNIVANKNGYVPGTLKNVAVEEGGVHYADWISLITDSSSGEYTVKGKITDAATGSGLSGVSMKFTNINDTSKTYTTTTDSSGAYSRKLPTGYYDVALTKTGYIASELRVASSSEMVSVSQDGTMSPTIDSNTYRIVLTWNENPRDLDSHLTGPTASGGSFHVYYPSSYKNAYDGGTLVANLDVDDTTSYGPETITLTPTTTGTYRYYVHRYAGSDSISTSGAQVKVYNGNRLVATYNAPTDQGTGDYWTVFELTNGTIKLINRIGNSVYQSGTSSVSVSTSASILDAGYLPPKD